MWLKRLLTILLLGLASSTSHAASSSYCVEDYGYGIFNDPLACFASLAEAKAFLYSNGKGEKIAADVDSSLFELRTTKIEYPQYPNLDTRRTEFLYFYRNVAPKTDDGQFVFSENWSGCGPAPDLYRLVNQWRAYGCSKLEDAVAADANWLSQNAGVPVVVDYVETTPGATGYKKNGARSTLVWQFQQVDKYCFTPQYPSGAGYPTCNTYMTAHFWSCPDTHSAFDAATLGGGCRSNFSGRISVDNEPIRLASYCSVGNPCQPQTGLKTQRERDFSWEGLDFTRAFHSSSDIPADLLFGTAWTHSLDVEKRDLGVGTLVKVGDELDVYRIISGGYFSTNRPGSRLIGTPSGPVVDRPDGKTYSLQLTPGTNTYRAVQLRDSVTNKSFVFDYCVSDAATCPLNALRRITASSGRFLDFYYEDVVAAGRSLGSKLKSISSAGDLLASYSYDDRGWLSSVEYPDQTGKAYFYNEAGHVCVSALGKPLSPCHPTGVEPLLTSIRDELGITYASFKYDNLGRVVSSEHSGVDKVAIDYPTPLSSKVTRESGVISTYGSLVGGSFYQLTSLVQGTTSESFSYDSRGFPDEHVDQRGIITDRDYDANGRLVRVARASGTLQEQVSTYEWDTALNVVKVTNKADISRTSRTFNARRQVLTETQESLTPPLVARTTTHTYCEQPDVDAGICPLLGLMTSTGGPRTDLNDVTTYTYYPSDDLTCATSPASCQRTTRETCGWCRTRSATSPRH